MELPLYPRGGHPGLKPETAPWPLTLTLALGCALTHLGQTSPRLAMPNSTKLRERRVTECQLGFVQTGAAC